MTTRIDGREPLLLPDHDIDSLDAYVGFGGGAALDRVLRLGPASVLDAIEAADIRGRGGAGFPAARKWRSIAAAAPEDGDRFVVANGAEGEPATFKDRLLLRRNPYQVVEGLLVAAVVVEAREAFIAVKASFQAERIALERALREMAAAGWVHLPVSIVAGPEEYLFGEEKALLEVIEGEDPLPRLLPPYEYGLFSSSPNLGWSANLDRSTSGPSSPSSNPTLVNNVETLAAVTAAVRMGSDEFRTYGATGGPLLVTVCGDTQRDAVAEISFGTPLGEVIDQVGGGLRPRRQLLAVLSGVANPVLTAAAVDLPLTYEAFAAAGSGLGAAGFWTLDDTADMAEVAEAVAWFLHVESCGQCSPCKLGSGGAADQLHRIRSGGDVERETAQLMRVLRTVTDGARCHLPVQTRDVVASIVGTFPDHLHRAAERAEHRPAPPLRLPKIVDIVGGRAIYDERQRRKRPDWSYAEQPVRIRGRSLSSVG